MILGTGKKKEDSGYRRCPFIPGISFPIVTKVPIEPFQVLSADGTDLLRTEMESVRETSCICAGLIKLLRKHLTSSASSPKWLWDGVREAGCFLKTLSCPKIPTSNSCVSKERCVLRS